MKKKLIVSILIVAVIYILLGMLGSAAFATAPGTLTSDINGIDDSKYPGYKSLMNDMKAKHPNYRFLVYYTGMDWNEVITAEYQGHGTSPLNLFQVGTNYNGMWQCPICGTQKYDNGSWCCASKEALAYMMDPRNSINDSDVFQFKDLEGSDVSYDDIARVVAGYGSYLNNQEAIQAIVDASVQYNVNGYFLVAKIVNEHGKNGSTLSNGQGYNGKYVGVYNYFNIGSYGNGTATIINNGLSHAQSKGWTSIRASIFGGAEVVKDSYIIRYSQNTLYYQKFNVSGKSAIASHQYQQNIMAAQSQGTSLKSYYGNSNTAGTYTFIIPLYENIPQKVATRPDVTKQNTITFENGVVQNVSTSLKVRASANGTAIGALNNGESIKIIKRADQKVGNYHWDLIVSNVDGTYGYAARDVGGENCIASIGTSGSSSGTAETPKEPEEPETPPEEQEPPKEEKEVDIEKDIVLKETGYIDTIPNVKSEDIIKKYENAVITDNSGNKVETGNLGTGYTVTIGEETFKIVKKGDITGDGTVNILDTVLLLNAIKGTKTLENEFKEAACLKNESDFNILDAVYMLNYIKGSADISV